MVLLVQVERTEKVTICIAVHGAAMDSKKQICLPNAKRLAKLRCAGNTHKLTGLSDDVRGLEGLHVIAAQPYVSACQVSCGK